LIVCIKPDEDEDKAEDTNDNNRPILEYDAYQTDEVTLRKNLLVYF
jgi:hypothetical protein